jgi:hypothetical protein
MAALAARAGTSDADPSAAVKLTFDLDHRLGADHRVAKNCQGIFILDDSHLGWQRSLHLAFNAQHASLSETAIYPECP